MASARKDNRGRILNKGEVQRKDKTYAYIYTSSCGKRNTLYAKTLAELRKKEEEAQNADIVVSRKMTINDAFKKYVSARSDIKITTLTNYHYVYEIYIEDEIGKRKLTDVKRSDILAFYLKLAREKHLRSSTIESVQSVLGPMFNMAIMDELIKTNPTAGVMPVIRRTLGADAIIKYPLTMEQQKAFLNYCRRTKFKKWDSFFTVLLGTGCRVGEVIGLRWQDVDLEKRTININHTMTYHMFQDGEEKVARFGITTPKTASGIRLIPMIEHVYNALMYEKDRQRISGGCKIVIDGMEGFIFFNGNGRPHSQRQVNRTIDSIVAGYNQEEMENALHDGRDPLLLPHFSAHNLRHTFCSRICENETDVKTIQTIMGHSNFSTTMNIYAKISEKKKADMMARLSRSLDVF